MKKENLIANKDEVETGFSGMSRREVIKRIGLGSMVALPIIASLTAPQASYAASTCGTACMCGNNNAGGAAGAICTTNGGGTACPAVPAGCQTCRQTLAGNNQPGMCFTA